MKNVKLGKLSIISLIMSALVVLLLVLNAVTGNKIVGPIYRAIANRLQGIDLESVMSYVVYDNSQFFDNNVNTNDIKVLLEFNNEDGIEYIITPQSKINANGKSKIALDWTTSYGMNEKFTVKLKDQDPIDKFLNITQEDVNNQFEVSVEETESGYINKVDYSFKQEGDNNYYTIGDNFWVNYNPNNMIVDYTKTRENPVGDFEGIAEIDLKKIDKNGNTVYAHKSAKIHSEKIYYFFHVNRLGMAGAGLSYSLQGGRENGYVEDYNTINTFDAKLGAYHGSWQGGYTADITIDLSKFSQSVNLTKAKDIIIKTHLAAYGNNSNSYANITREYEDGTSVTTSDFGFGNNNERDFESNIEIIASKNISKIKIHFSGRDGSNQCAGGWLSSLNFEIEPDPKLITITYDPNGGSGTMNPTQAIIARAEENRFTSIDPVCIVFKEWNTEPDGTGQSYAPGDIIEEDDTLYAIWELTETLRYPIITDTGYKNSAQAANNYLYKSGVEPTAFDAVTSGILSSTYSGGLRKLPGATDWSDFKVLVDESARGKSFSIKSYGRTGTYYTGNIYSCTSNGSKTRLFNRYNEPETTTTITIPTNCEYLIFQNQLNHYFYAFRMI